MDHPLFHAAPYPPEPGLLVEKSRMIPGMLSSDSSPPSGPRQRSLSIIGAGPVGLSLALIAARALPRSTICLLDSRPAGLDVSADPRVLAVSLGSVQLLRRLRAWPERQTQSILEVHVSQQTSPLLGEPHLRIRADQERVPMLGSVVAYGHLVAALQRAWYAMADSDPQRLKTVFDRRVNGLKTISGGVEVDADVVEDFDLAVVAEGGTFGEQARKVIHRDYEQNAWVGTVQLPEQAPPAVAYERFTSSGPVALLPLPGRRAALVWCVDSRDDSVATLDDEQRLTVLNSIFPAQTRPLSNISPLKLFPLGLNAERTVASGRVVRIGNAAQTLHPVAGQGLNLGLRDAWALVEALRRHSDTDMALRHLVRQRAPDRWTTIGITDFLARGFTWQLPGAASARGLAIAALQTVGPLRSALARRMMFGSR